MTGLFARISMRASSRIYFISSVLVTFDDSGKIAKTKLKDIRKLKKSNSLYIKKPMTGCFLKYHLMGYI